MPTLTSSKETFEFSLEEIKKLITKDLEKDPEKISVNYVIQEVGGDPMDRYPGVKTVTKIQVTVNK